MMRLCSATFGATAYTDISGGTLSPGIQAALLSAAGNYQASFNAVMRQTPVVGFNLLNIAALAAPSYTTASLFFRQEVEGAVAGSGYVSVTGATNKCLVVPQSINWQAGGPARLGVQILFLSTDGDTPPLTVATSTGALTGVSLAYSGAMNCVESIAVNFGYGLTFCEDGHLYPQKVFVTQQAPSITLVTADEAGVTTAKMNPGEVDTLSAVFAEVAEGGVRGDSLTFALTGLITRSVAGDNPAKVTVTCQGKGGFTIS